MRDSTGGRHNVQRINSLGSYCVMGLQNALIYRTLLEQLLLKLSVCDDALLDE
jgi:hypothetical protein